MRGSSTFLKFVRVAAFAVVLLAVADKSEIVAHVETQPVTEPDEATIRQWVGQLIDPDRAGEVQQNSRTIADKARGSVPTLIKMLKSDDRSRQMDALVILRTVGPVAKEAIPAILPLLTVRGDRSEVSVRFNAALALARVGRDVKPVMPMLLAAIEGTEARGIAVWTLGEIGPDAKDAVPALIATLNDSDRDVRIKSIVALGKIGPAAEKAIPALTELAESGGIWFPDSTKEFVQKALAQITGNPELSLPSEYELFHRGSQLSAERAAKLEDKLQQNPKDLDSRLQLIGYSIAVTGKRASSPAAVTKSARQKRDDLSPDSTATDNSPGAMAFDSLDTNKDGQLTEDEWKRSRSTRTRFEKSGIAVTLPIKRAQFVELCRQAELIAELSKHYPKNKSEAIAVRRDLYFAEVLFRRGDIDSAEAALRPALERFELLVKTNADLATDGKTLGEGLWAIMVWRTIYQLKEQTPAKEFPLKWLWEKESARVPKIQQEFNRLYGPPS